MFNGFLHHFNKRRDAKSELRPYPHSDWRIRFLDRLVVMAAIAAPLANIPQLLEIFVNKNAAGLSLATWISFVIINCLWIIYGLVHKERLVAFASSFAICFFIPIVIGIIIYQ